MTRRRRVAPSAGRRKGRLDITVSIDGDILTIRIPLGTFVRQAVRDIIEDMGLPQFLRELGIEPIGTAGKHPKA